MTKAEENAITNLSLKIDKLYDVVSKIPINCENHRLKIEALEKYSEEMKNSASNINKTLEPVRAMEWFRNNWLSVIAFLGVLVTLAYRFGVIK